MDMESFSQVGALCPIPGHATHLQDNCITLMLIGKQYMKTLVSKKSIDYANLEHYLVPAHNSNQFSNGGHASRVLEGRARDILQIDDSKAVIATCSGTAALHAIIFAFQRSTEKV